MSNFLNIERIFTNQGDKDQNALVNGQTNNSQKKIPMALKYTVK